MDSIGIISAGCGGAEMKADREQIDWTMTASEREAPYLPSVSSGPVSGDGKTTRQDLAVTYTA